MMSQFIRSIRRRIMLHVPVYSSTIYIWPCQKLNFQFGKRSRKGVDKQCCHMRGTSLSTGIKILDTCLHKISAYIGALFHGKAGYRRTMLNNVNRIANEPVK